MKPWRQLSQTWLDDTKLWLPMIMPPVPTGKPKAGQTTPFSKPMSAGSSS